MASAVLLLRAQNAKMRNLPQILVFSRLHRQSAIRREEP